MCIIVKDFGNHDRMLFFFFLLILKPFSPNMNLWLMQAILFYASWAFKALELDLFYSPQHTGCNYSLRAVYKRRYLTPSALSRSHRAPLNKIRSDPAVRVAESEHFWEQFSFSSVNFSSIQLFYSQRVSFDNHFAVKSISQINCVITLMIT